jgi:hypothetical protein
MMRRPADLDPLERALASLPLHEPSASRRARIRARAHRALQRPRYEGYVARSMAPASWPRAIEWAIVGAAAFYLAAVVRLAVSLAGR